MRTVGIILLSALWAGFFTISGISCKKKEEVPPQETVAPAPEPAPAPATTPQESTSPAPATQ